MSIPGPLKHNTSRDVSGTGHIDEPPTESPISTLVVSGGASLEGRVRVAGAKNSALKLMAASLLAEGSYRLCNVPRITDVALMSDVLRATGCSVHWEAADPAPELIIDVPAQIEPVAPYELVERFRASIVVLGPLLARCGTARVALPGGDDFGPRPIDMHVRGLSELGAVFETVHGYIHASAPTLTGSRVLLEFPSVGATENILMAAVLAEGVTVIDNAAREPEIADLCELLNKMGADVVGSGSSTLTIRGVDEMHAADHTVIPDRIEAATYLAAVGVAGGEITIEGARHDHMAMLCQKLGDMGMRISPDPGGLWVMAPDRLRSVDCPTLPYPGLATDFMPFLVALLATTDGVGIVTENLFAGRFRYVDELRRMGADIRTDTHHAVIRGVERLSGAPVKAHDIRAGAALVVAGLGAEGATVVSDAEHVARGYEDLAGKLSGLGADVVAE